MVFKNVLSKSQASLQYDMYGVAIKRLCRDTIIRMLANYGGGAGNRTPVRQGPAAGFSVRSPRFSVGSGLPETGYPHPSFLRLDPARESRARGAVTISDVRKGSWRRKPQGTWTLLKRPVRSYRWQLLFAPCFASSGNSARCP